MRMKRAEKRKSQEEENGVITVRKTGSIATRKKIRVGRIVVIIVGVITMGRINNNNLVFILKLIYE